jgi:hypothetical protein
MPAAFKDHIKVIDRYGFHHEIRVEHHPEIGVSIAHYRELRISQFPYGRILLPRTDDDNEWEQFQERFYESVGGEALSFFELECKQIIDNQQ